MPTQSQGRALDDIAYAMKGLVAGDRLGPTGFEALTIAIAGSNDRGAWDETNLARSVREGLAQVAEAVQEGLSQIASAIESST